MEINLKLTDEQVQRALSFLGQAPYIDVADIIDTIKKQANEQLKQEQATTQ